MTTRPFSLDLAPVAPDRTPLTFMFSVAIAGTTVWPIANAPEHRLEIQLDDLFSHLVEFWKPLLLRQTYPISPSPVRPANLNRDCAKRWEDMPQEQVDTEASAVEAFEDAHNLSRSFGGLFELPPLWLVREGDSMICDTGRAVEQVPFHHVCGALTEVGDWIAGHLLRIDAGKWRRIVEAWSRRDIGDHIDLVSWSASLEPAVAEQLIGSGLIDPPKSFAEAANDDDELLIAARMAGALPTEQIIEILSLARRFDHHAAERLDALSAAAGSHLARVGRMKPFAQGQELAKFARRWLNAGPSELVDVFAVAAGLGIQVLVETAGPATFDGLAIAGSRYGPGAFINVNSFRIRDRGLDTITRDAGARVNLSHELCHLLIDRTHPLSAIEVLRSRMPAAIESRARAFAAEFLLPGEAAADLWSEAGSPTDHDDLQRVLQALADKYAVSFSVAAWKLEHGARQDGRALSLMLDELALYR